MLPFLSIYLNISEQDSLRQLKIIATTIVPIRREISKQRAIYEFKKTGERELLSLLWYYWEEERKKYCTYYLFASFK